MELRNRRLTDEERAKEQQQDQDRGQEEREDRTMPSSTTTTTIKEKMEVEVEEEAGAERQGVQAKSISSVGSDDEMDVDDAGGFLGDFEEIDEDEAIERFISQNHTPTISTRETPEASHQAEDSSDGEDSFEPIIEKPAEQEEPAEQTALPADNGEKQLLVGSGKDDRAAEQPQPQPQDQDQDQAPGALSTGGSAVEKVPEWRALEDQFREKFIPKLPPDQFFQAQIYKQYSVVSTLAKGVSDEAPAKAADPKPTPVQPTNAETPSIETPAPAVQQKPSSLRMANNSTTNSSANADSRTRSHNQGEDGPAASTRARTAVADKQDDVVGALLGAMQSPGKKEAETQAEQPSHIPSDMLAAMMAIDGIDVGTKRPVAADANADAQRQLAKELTNRLPKGYAGLFSQLTMEEHARYLFLAQRARQAKDQAEFQRLKQRVESEQKEFRSQIKEKTLDRLRMIEPWVDAAAKQHLSKQKELALETYPRLYVPARVTAIKPIGSGYIPLVYKKTLLQRGTCYGVREKVSEQALSDPWAGSRQAVCERPVMTRDPHVRQLALQTQADVALSDSALAALLTLQKMHMHDVLLPVEVVANGDRRLVIVDRPLVVGRSATPRKLRQLVFDAAVRQQMVDRSGENRLALGPGDQQSQQSQLEEPDASYTLWEFGDTRLLVRCGINGFSGDAAGENGAQPARTTVTLASKLEYYADSTASEVALATGGSAAAQRPEDTTECDRLAWWLAAFLRGSPSQVWVTHVAPGAQPTRVSRLGCTDLFPPSAPQPPTHALRDVLAEFSRLTPGKYMLQHRRSAWDATILRAVDDSAAGAGMDLAAELDVGAAAAAASYVDADYVPPVWHGLPAQIPWTYPPADLAAELGPQQTQHKKRRTGGRANKRNKNKKR